MWLTVHDGCSQATRALTVLAQCNEAPVVVRTRNLAVSIDGVTGLARDVIAAPPDGSNISYWMQGPRNSAVLDASLSRNAVSSMQDVLFFRWEIISFIPDGLSRTLPLDVSTFLVGSSQLINAHAPVATFSPLITGVWNFRVNVSTTPTSAIDALDPLMRPGVLCPASSADVTVTVTCNVAPTSVISQAVINAESFALRLLPPATADGSAVDETMTWNPLELLGGIVTWGAYADDREDGSVSPTLASSAQRTLRFARALLSGMASVDPDTQAANLEYTWNLVSWPSSSALGAGALRRAHSGVVASFVADAPGMFQCGVIWAVSLKSATI